MHAIPRPDWRTCLVAFCLCCITLLAFGVRTYRLDFPVLSFDEAFSWGLSRFSPGEIVGRTGADVHPPLYYVMLKYWVQLFGASSVSPRFSSAFWGIACVPLAYFVCLEAAAAWPHPGAGRAVARQGALLVALLVALHGTQVESSRVLRMYSLGLFLSGATTWLLLRALRPDRGGWWWPAYGLAAALFAYTHHYAFFTIAGQTLFVAGYLARRWRRSSFRDVRESAFGFTYAGVIALVLYAPWVPMFWSQLHQVKQDYWIPALSWSAVERAVTVWTCGMLLPDGFETYGWLAVVASVILFTLIKGGPAAWLFVLSAVTPWVLSVCLSFGSRSIFVDRYLAFAQFPLLCSLSVTWRCLPGYPIRLALASVLVGSFTYGLAENLQHLPDRPTILAEAAGFVGQHARPGDIVFVEDACEVNLFGYYLTRSGVEGVTVRTTQRPGRTDRLHFGSCLLSVSPSDFQPTEELPLRYWGASYADLSAPLRGAGRKVIVERAFGGERGGRFTVVLFERTR